MRDKSLVISEPFLRLALAVLAVAFAALVAAPK